MKRKSKKFIVIEFKKTTTGIFMLKTDQ